MPTIPNIDITPPKYGPPDYSAELFKMLSGLPGAYQTGVESRYKQRALERQDVTGEIQLEDLKDYVKNPPKLSDDPHGAGTASGDGIGAAAPRSNVDKLVAATGGANPEGAGPQQQPPGGGGGPASFADRFGAAYDDTTGAIPPGGVPGGAPGGAPGLGPVGAPGPSPGAPPAPGAQVAQAGQPGSYTAPLAQYGAGVPPRPTIGDPDAPWTQRRVKEALTEADRLDKVAGRPGLAALPGRVKELQERAKGLREEAKQAQEFINKQRELTTKQKEAPPGMSVPEAEAFTAATKAQAEASMKNVATRIEGQKGARDTIQVLDEMENALDKGKNHIATGPGAVQWLNVKRAVNNILPGTFENVTEAETIEKLNAQLAAAAAKSMTARPSQLEFKAFMSNNPGLFTSPGASKKLIDFMRQQKQQELELGRMADKFKLGGPKSWSEIEENYYRNHPITDPDTKKPIDARKAKDGNWYRPDPDRPGKYLKESG